MPVLGNFWQREQISGTLRVQNRAWASFMHVRTFGILGEVVDRAHTVQSVRDIYRDLMMKPLYEESLIGAYSTIYQNLQPRFPGGERFECGDGWYRIVEELSAELEAIARVGGVNRLNVVQVKEKLAALRVYFDRPAPPTAIAVVDAAIQKSRITCELCGEPGKLCRYREGWLRTLCEKCATEAHTEGSRVKSLGARPRSARTSV